MDVLTTITILIWVAIAILFAVAAWADSARVRESVIGVR